MLRINLAMRFSKGSCMTKLEEFLDEPANMHAREAILMHRLFFDVQLAAAKSGYYLNTYFDNVDHDGFDVIFDDQDTLKKIQVKTLRKGASTKSWKIHKGILRPTIGMTDKYGFEASPEGIGVNGGCILMEYCDNQSGELEIDYFYTDLSVLMAFECEILKVPHKAKQNALQRCLTDLTKGYASEMLAVPKVAFLKAKNINSLLSLLNLHGLASNNWVNNVLAVTNNTRLSADQSISLPMPIEELKEYTLQRIKSLADV